MMIEHISSFFRNLNETAGLNFIVFYDDYEFSRFLEGALISLRLMAFSILLSLVIGVLGAWAQTSKSAIIRVAVDAYIQAFRNTPPMIQLLFFYFGLGAFTPAVDMGGYYEPIISSFGWAVISLGLSLVGRSTSRYSGLAWKPFLKRQKKRLKASAFRTGKSICM